MPRKMAREKRLVDRHVLARQDAPLRLELQHPVDQQERLAMRQMLHDPLDVQHRPPVRALGRASRWSRRASATLPRWLGRSAITWPRSRAPTSARSPITSTILWRTNSSAKRRSRSSARLSSARMIVFSADEPRASPAFPQGLRPFLRARTSAAGARRSQNRRPVTSSLAYSSPIAGMVELDARAHPEALVRQHHVPRVRPR